MWHRLNILFYTFIAIFLLTAIVTLLGIVGAVKIDPAIRNSLLAAFLLELAGAVIAMFKLAPFFGESSDSTTALAKSIAVIDEFTDQLEAVVCGQLQAETNRQYGIVVRRERGALVAYQRMQVITGDDLQKLPAEQRETLATYEASMKRFHKSWKSTWAKRSAASTDSERVRIEADLQRLVRGMQEDLHGILDFLASQGMVLQDHYTKVRYLVDEFVAAKRGDSVPPMAAVELKR
ncbi:hypothetical protein [Burkholderia ubonensis]|uniref:hypothetical protein n=1 Tax=Burkholderia ubonensis TaxID=101571 RepID=UPI000AFC224F|nr:hypothetical protein [Burkholderia ubonensis]